MLFISHDLETIRALCDRVVVLYLGCEVESGPVDTVFKNPAHPYTQALLAEVPKLEKRGHDFAPITGEIPSPIDPPAGCHFHPRCPHAMERCRSERPQFRQIAPGHWSAWYLNDAK